MAARLSSLPRVEKLLLVSSAAAAGLNTEDGESRRLDLKGIAHPVAVRVLRLEVDQGRAVHIIVPDCVAVTWLRMLVAEDSSTI
jgi:hypothetical protein